MGTPAGSPFHAGNEMTPLEIFGGRRSSPVGTGDANVRLSAVIQTSKRRSNLSYRYLTERLFFTSKR